jgi:hypothetical protein
MRPLIAVLIVAAVAIGGGIWYASHAPEPTGERPAELLEATRDFAAALAVEDAPASAATTLATLPAQRIMMRVVSYGVPVALTGVDASGTQMSLHDMFVPANIDVLTDVQPVRTYPFASNYITEAELSTLASEPQSDGGGWKVTAFLLKRGTQPGDLGTIFPQRSRQRFAVFADEIGNKNKVLRTTAHELGHTLNLYHDDGDAQCCVDGTRNGTSLMNQDRCLNQQAWRYRLEAMELDHLRNHSVTSVNPNGTVPFGFCSMTHERKC